jgi:diacylglycerol kinase family enzyme
MPTIDAGAPLPQELDRIADDAPITILMNAGSGQKDKSPAHQAIQNVLLPSGRDVKVIEATSPDQLVTLGRQAAVERTGILVAAGGDGTLNAIADIACEHKLPFAILPLGTFNYFARDLGISLDPAEAAFAILQGYCRRMPVGRINGHLFLNNASIGLYRKLLQEREKHKQRFGRYRLVAMFSAAATLFQPHRRYRLTLEIDGKTELIYTPSVFFGRNALQMEQLGLDEADCVARGELAILAPRDLGRMQMLGLALRGAVAQLETAENLRQYCGMRVKADWIDASKRRIKVAVDGEILECTLPLKVESVPSALQVIVPKTPEERK